MTFKTKLPISYFYIRSYRELFHHRVEYSLYQEYFRKKSFNPKKRDVIDFQKLPIWYLDILSYREIRNFPSLLISLSSRSSIIEWNINAFTLRIFSKKSNFISYTKYLPEKSDVIDISIFLHTEKFETCPLLIFLPLFESSIDSSICRENIFEEEIP